MTTSPETDAEIYDRVLRRTDARQAVDILTREMTYGDRETVADATDNLSDHASAREIAAIKRHIKR